jgi:amidase
LRKHGTSHTEPVSEPHELTALGQAEAIRRGELGLVELVEHLLRRVRRLDPEVGAFVTLTPERALDAARAAQRTLGDTPHGGLSRLFGVPTAIKDLALTAGVRTTFGSQVYAEYVPELDDDAVTLLARAGTISFGKTAVPEFGLPPYTEPAGRRATVTPWDTRLLAGGSSGGAAAAVAAGMVPIAHGTDGGGSIRIPASVCGVVGLKTSRGLVSRGPLGGDPLGFSVSGPIARTVTDAAAMLDVLAAPVLGGPFARPGRYRPGEYLEAARRADPGRLRIGRYATPPLPGVALDPACQSAYDQASTVLTRLGHEVVDMAGPGIELDAATEFVAMFEVLWAVLASGDPVPADAEHLLCPLTRWWRAKAERVSGTEFLRAAHAAQLVSRRIIAAHSAYDVVLTPTIAQLPRPVGWFTEGGDPARDYARQVRFTPFTSIYNITGQPAVSVPLSWSEPGQSGQVLPVGVQLVGLPGADRLLLELASALEVAVPWSDRRPPAW